MIFLKAVFVRLVSSAASRVPRWTCLPQSKIAAVSLCLLLSSCALFRPKHVDGPAGATQIGNVSVQFAGVTAFTDADLRDALADPFDTIQNEGLSRATADDAAYFLELYYRKNGYAFASASYDLPGARQLRLKVDEGPLVILGDIRFTGNEHYVDPVNFREYVVGQTRERFPRGRTEFPYVQADAQKGVDVVRNFYLAEGFLNAQVAAPVVNYTNNRTRANLTIAITEGQRYRFGEVTFVGPLVFDPNEVRGLIADQFPLPYTKPRVDSMQRKLEDFYKKRGYYTATVAVDSDAALADAAGRIPTLFSVNPGPLYHFDGTRIVGLDRLKPEYLRNRFKKLSGQVYNPDALDELYQKMIRTGLFSVLRVTPQTQPNDTLRLDIDVKEAKSREVGYSIGYGTFEGPILGVELRDRDFRGTGRPISFAVDYSTRTLSGELLYTDPNLFETDYELRLRLSALTRQLDGYDKTEINGLAEIARQVTKQVRLTAFVLAKKEKISTLAIEPYNAGLLDYASESVGVAAVLDYRDNPVSPTRGWISNVSFDVASSAFGGDLDFVRGTFRLSYYQPIGGPNSKMLLLAGFRAGIVHPFGDSQGPFYVENDTDPKTPTVPRGSRFPIDERFFNGGSTSVRSFGERELGPYDHHSDNPIGGEAFTIFNLEYVFPLVLADLRGALFFDAGNLREEASDIGFSNERYGVGAGLRYNLPIGPLRLDYGVNPSPRPHESFGAFHFSFGFAF